jgi:DNA-binding NarL/FixJ family response regulator
LTRQCLSQALAQNWPGTEITVLGEPLEALKDQRLCRGAELVLLNLGAAHATAPLPRSTIRRLVGHFAGVPLVVFGDHEDIEDVVAAIQLGARGYIPTSQDLVEVAEALRFVCAGGTFVPASSLIKCAPQLMAELRGHGRACDRLTPREMEVLVRLRQGMPNKGIAHELDISESTVKVFVRRILAKLHAVNRTEVAYLTQHQFEDVTADSA